eukprot:SAG31_NODE_3735_length_3938_cov_1.264913_2_plen_73_part_00
MCRGIFIIGTVFVILRRAALAYSQVRVGTSEELKDWVKKTLDKSQHATALQVQLCVAFPFLFKNTKTSAFLC